MIIRSETWWTHSSTIREPARYVLETDGPDKEGKADCQDP